MITALNTPVDTSPAAIAARRRHMIFSRQDKALELREAGLSNREIGKELEVETPRAQKLAMIAWNRRRDMQASLEPFDASAIELTKPETALIEAILQATFRLWESGETRSPESRNVAFVAKRSQGWVTATARKRIAKMNNVKGSPIQQPGLDLVDVRGNGYVHLTNSGWALSRALFPHYFD